MSAHCNMSSQPKGSAKLEFTFSEGQKVSDCVLIAAGSWVLESNLGHWLWMQRHCAAAPLCAMCLHSYSALQGSPSELHSLN